MPSRGRHQSTSPECRRVLDKIEALPGVNGVIIGRSYGGRSLGRNNRTGTVRLQRQEPGGFKAVIQTTKGLQEFRILVESGHEEAVSRAVEALET